LDVPDNNAILTEFDNVIPEHRLFADKLRDLIVDILGQHSLPVHSVTGRAKTRESFAEKVTKSEGRYTTVSDVTDTCGVRIIAYFASDVDRIAETLVHRTQPGGATSNDYRYTGEQNDRGANRGLYYLRARHYDPALGRFLSKDPLLTSNRYAYAGNNPCTLSDPSGLAATEGGGWQVSCNGSVQAKGFRNAFLGWCARRGSSPSTVGLCVAAYFANDDLFSLDVAVVFTKGAGGAITSQAQVMTGDHPNGVYQWDRTGYTISHSGDRIHATATFATSGWRNYLYDSTGTADIEFAVDGSGAVSGYARGRADTWRTGNRAFNVATDWWCTR